MIRSRRGAIGGRGGGDNEGEEVEKELQNRSLRYGNFRKDRKKNDPKVYRLILS